MSKKMISKFVFGCLLFLVSVPFFLGAQTAPDKFLGFQVGADRQLADYSQIQGYFKKLAQESPRLKLLTIGASTLNKPMIMAVISTAENLAQLDRYRDITHKLRDPRTLSEDAARELARTGKAIVLVTCSLHASEIAASQMSMEFAYRLVSGKTPFDADKILHDVIVLLVPASNPDGEQMITEYYRKYVGTKYEGGNLPWLYHHYAGHDNNRDWYMFNLPETRAITNVLYHDWLPQIHIDEHQMGSTGARLFIPPFMDPPIPNVQPMLWRGVNLCGTAMSYDLQKNGFRGVTNGRSFTGWWIGACDDTSWLHNTIGILSEMASARIASPMFIEPTEIPQSFYEKRMDFIDPWPGGMWRLRDIVDYELTLSFSLVKTAALHREDFLFNAYKMNKISIEVREKNQPFAFVIPAQQHDYATAMHMLDVLIQGGVEVQQAKADFFADGKLYVAGSFVVAMAQPYKPYAWALLEKQKYPDMRQYPGGPPVPPYDNAGWTLPLQMGVACDQIESAFSAKLEHIAQAPRQVKALPDTAYLVLDARHNASYGAVFALLKEKAEVYRSSDKIVLKNGIVAAGSFIVKNSAAVKKTLAGVQDQLQLTVHGLDNGEKIAKNALQRFRVGLYQSWRGNMDEGWTRYVFDSLGIPYTTLHNDQIKGSKDKKVNLRADFDAIVFADENADMIKTGKPKADSEYARYYVANWPPEYEGGIEKEGVEALKTFVEQGGVLVLLNRACELAMQDFQVPARNALERIEQSKFFCPSSILKLDVDNQSPIGYGMPREASAMFASSLALSTNTPLPEWDRKVVAAYAEDNVLQSGWLLGEEYVARKAAVVDTRYKDGRIILIGFRCQSRAQSHGTYKFLLNALLYPEIK